jgi:hypothetical protein
LKEVCHRSTMAGPRLLTVRRVNRGDRRHLLRAGRDNLRRLQLVILGHQLGLLTHMRLSRDLDVVEITQPGADLIFSTQREKSIRELAWLKDKPPAL